MAIEALLSEVKFWFQPTMARECDRGSKKGTGQLLTKATRRVSFSVPPLFRSGFIAWGGTYDDIRQDKPGQYRVSLLKTFKAGFYPGIHLLPDGTLVATTYANYHKNDISTSIISVRFTMNEWMR